MPSDFDARCRLIQGDTFSFVDLYGAKWFSRGTATKLTTGYSVGTDGTLSPAAGTAPTAQVTLETNGVSMAGKQMYGLSFDRQYTVYQDNTYAAADTGAAGSNNGIIEGDAVPNSQVFQQSTYAAAFHGPTFRSMSKAQLEQTSITYKQAVDTRARGSTVI